MSASVTRREVLGGLVAAGALAAARALPARSAVQSRNLLVPPAGHAWFGADPGNLSAYQSLIRRKLPVVCRYQSWDGNWPNSSDKALVAGGQLLSCRWSGRLSGGGYVQWADIPTGKYDRVLDAAAQRWAAWGRPMWVSPFGEFDGHKAQRVYAVGLYIQDTLSNSRIQAAFVAAWRHIHARIAPVAPNVIWAWVITGAWPGAGTLGLYPGSSYVDWAGFDKYDWTGSRGSPLNTYSSALDWLHANGIVKPTGVFETGIEAGTVSDATKAAWIGRVPSDCAQLGLSLWAWFDVGIMSVPLGSMSATALARIGASPFFAW